MDFGHGYWSWILVMDVDHGYESWVLVMACGFPAPEVGVDEG